MKGFLSCCIVVFRVHVWSRLKPSFWIGCVVGLGLIYVAMQDAYMDGFDGGAAASSCLHFHLLEGSEEAMKSDACKDAAEFQQTLGFKLFGHRIGREQ